MGPPQLIINVDFIFKSLNIVASLGPAEMPAGTRPVKSRALLLALRAVAISIPVIELVCVNN